MKSVRSVHSSSKPSQSEVTTLTSESPGVALGGPLGDTREECLAPAVTATLAIETRDAARAMPRIQAAERAMPLWADSEAPRKQAKARPGSYSGGRSS